MPCRVCRLSGRTVYRCHWLVIAFMNARKRSSAVRQPTASDLRLRRQGLATVLILDRKARFMTQLSAGVAVGAAAWP